MIADGEGGWVVDGATGALEWNYALGFGYRLALADLDGHGLAAGGGELSALARRLGF